MSPTEDLDRLVVRTRDDALQIVAAIARRSSPGIDWVLGLRRDRTFQVAFPVDADPRLPELVALVAGVALPGEALLVVSDRSGEAIADRPDDELTWEEMVGAATAVDVVLLDWFVVWGTRAFSIAEFAPTPAGW
jgi:hypothetical protein